MRLPKSVTEKMTEGLFLTVDSLYELDYPHSVALSQTLDKGNPLYTYVCYFKAEQELDTARKDHFFTTASQNTSQEHQALCSIIQGRRMLEQKSVHADELQQWSERAMSRVPAPLHPYVSFLAGMVCLNNERIPQADHWFQKSASHFFKFSQNHRELVSHLHRPSLTVDEIILLRNYAFSVEDTKCIHIANFQLARKYFNLGDVELSKRFCEQAEYGFTYEFPDPRRKRLAVELNATIKNNENATHVLTDLTGLEALLWKMLQAGPKTKSELIDHIFGVQHDTLMVESFDSRFRSLLYRLNKKSPSRIRKVGDKYFLFK